ncbi:MAG: phytanoyl-CoA dioxygenase family protein [Gammaproteobacteria bacterium]|nr:phytanoyl-CoA dioxygenase family protein [Gammaproteobacteria bacterium]
MAPSVVSETARGDFRRDGFVVLRSVIDGATLDMLREECAVFVARTDAWLDRRGTDVFGITHRGKRYFIANRYRDSERMVGFVYGDLMRDITTALLGETVFLFNEQWVVKGAEQGMKFAWHQDSGYVNFRDPGNTHRPYLTCWCALDDMTRENGTISVMPHDRVSSQATVFAHRHEPGSNDLVGYEGDDPGVLVEMPAGSVAVFTSTSLHKSGANTTPRLRRAYLTQYTREPLRSSNGELWGQAVPFVVKGQYVYDPNTDVDARTGRRVRARTDTSP